MEDLKIIIEEDFNKMNKNTVFKCIKYCQKRIKKLYEK